MNRFEAWMLNRIAKKAATQGDHFRKIEIFYGVLIAAARDSFAEGNRSMLNKFLSERHERALNDD